jgi:hypothetical protein
MSVETGVKVTLQNQSPDKLHNRASARPSTSSFRLRVYQMRFFRGKLCRVQMSDRYGFLVLFVIILLFGLYWAINPKATGGTTALIRDAAQPSDRPLTRDVPEPSTRLTPRRQGRRQQSHTSRGRSA